MTDADLTPLFEAVRQAVHLCRTVQQTRLTSSDKGRSDPVTIADYGAQAILCRAISQVYPQDAIVAEEQGTQFLTLVPEPLRVEVCQLLAETLNVPVSQDDMVRWLDFGRGYAAERTWVIDPIDGTKGFLARRHYAIAVGLLHNGQPAGAVMAAPGYGDGGAVFWSLNGTAIRQGVDGAAPQAIHVSDRTAASDLRVVQSIDQSHFSSDRITRIYAALGLAGKQIISLDSMEKYARVASGEAELYLRVLDAGSTYRHNTWDHAAGAALVIAAGGQVTDVDGSPLDFSQGATLPNRGMIVTNGRIHARVVEAVQSVLRGE